MGRGLGGGGGGSSTSFYRGNGWTGLNSTGGNGGDLNPSNN
ncbi:hypothetical protein [Mycobacterium sp. TY815]|nr:hypothetical protein [Mycobacterium sp. TY815]MDP7707111.1 hypothetical protein [Mycobacterium sp. TY815]